MQQSSAGFSKRRGLKSIAQKNCYITRGITLDRRTPRQCPPHLQHHNTAETAQPPIGNKKKPNPPNRDRHCPFPRAKLRLLLKIICLGCPPRCPPIGVLLALSIFFFGLSAVVAHFYNPETFSRLFGPFALEPLTVCPTLLSCVSCVPVTLPVSLSSTTRQLYPRTPSTTKGARRPLIYNVVPIRPSAVSHGASFASSFSWFIISELAARFSTTSIPTSISISISAAASTAAY